MFAHFKGSALYQWLLDQRGHLANVLNIACIALLCYWIFRLITVKVNPRAEWIHITDNPSDARVYLIFGLIGAAFFVVMLGYVIRLLYNMGQDGLLSLFTLKWYSVVKPISYILALVLTFTCIGTIKSAAHTTYNQIKLLAHVSNHGEFIVQDKSTAIFDLVDGKSEE